MPKRTKFFTVEQANACLPLVRRIAADIVALSRELLDRRRRLEQLKTGRNLGGGDLYGDELVQIEEELEKDAEKLQGYLREIMDLGAEPKDALQGLVDFPAMLDGRLVYLCWKYDEPELLYWHELEAGFAGRQPLTAGSVAGDDSQGQDLLGS
jgi:hypothetical protein